MDMRYQIFCRTVQGNIGIEAKVKIFIPNDFIFYSNFKH